VSKGNADVKLNWGKMDEYNFQDKLSRLAEMKASLAEAERPHKVMKTTSKLLRVKRRKQTPVDTILQTTSTKYVDDSFDDDFASAFVSPIKRPITDVETRNETPVLISERQTPAVVASKSHQDLYEETFKTYMSETALDHTPIATKVSHNHARKSRQQSSMRKTPSELNFTRTFRKEASKTLESGSIKDSVSEMLQNFEIKKNRRNHARAIRERVKAKYEKRQNDLNRAMQHEDQSRQMKIEARRKQEQFWSEEQAAIDSQHRIKKQMNKRLRQDMRDLEREKKWQQKNRKIHMINTGQRLMQEHTHNYSEYQKLYAEAYRDWESTPTLIFGRRNHLRPKEFNEEENPLLKRFYSPTRTTASRYNR